MVKNTGIPGNQLSDLDFGQVLKDSHNKPLHALDVNQINSLVPSSYSKVSITRDTDCQKITKIEFYGLGQQEIQDVLVRENVQGTYEFSTFSFVGKVPSDLDGKYVILYDDSGSVGVWFDLDNSSTPPTTGASRDIEVDIASGDSVNQLASKFATAMNNDSSFSGTTLLSLAIIQSSTVGNKTNATIGNTTLGLSIQDGIDSLKGKLFYVYNNDDSKRYAFYYTIDSIGTQPAYTGESITAIDISSSDGSGQVASKTATIVNQNTYLTSTVSGTKFRISWKINGNTTGFFDSNTGFISSVIQEGQNLQLVATILLEYNSCGELSGVERV